MIRSRLVLLIAATLAAAPVPGAAPQARRMVRIPAGEYRPPYAAGPAVPVQSFLIDRDPVTRGDYLAWRGGRVLSPADARRPMTGVTWAEARAFCQAKGGRLPTLAEWEYVAAASPHRRNAAGDPAVMQHVASLYAARSSSAVVDSAEVNAFGVRGMHDLVWEWVADPNERMAALHHAGMTHDHADPRASQDLSCAGAAIGAADPRDYPAFLRAAFRSGLTETTRLASLGFRCGA